MHWFLKTDKWFRYNKFVSGVLIRIKRAGVQGEGLQMQVPRLINRHFLS